MEGSGPGENGISGTSSEAVPQARRVGLSGTRGLWGSGVRCKDMASSRNERVKLYSY